MPFPPRAVNAYFGGFSTADLLGLRDGDPVDRATRARVRCATRETGSMSKLNEANERLDAALEQLESAVTARREQAEKDAGVADGNQQLQDELTKLRAEFATLQETSGTVSGRLDDAIGRLRNMLAE